MTTTKFNKSRIFRAAWMMVKKYHMTISASLKKAWAFAKNDIAKASALQIEGFVYKIWNADKFTRFYFEDQSYLQMTITERKPYGYYENHRYCKGERFTTTWVKAVGEIALSLVDNFIAERGFALSKF